MIRVYKTPRLLKSRYPSLVWEKKSPNEIYLTFDDGPHPDITPWVIERLEKAEAKATFFCVGKNLMKSQEVSEHARRKGHAIANHTFNHENGWKTKTTEYLNSVEKCQNLLNSTSRGKILFRPPYGRIKNNQVERLVSNYEIIMWSHLSWDFDPDLSVTKSIGALKKAKPGSIIVFHDSEKAEKNMKQILPEMLDYWNDMNYKMNTL